MLINKGTLKKTWKKILPYMLALGIGASALTGCATYRKYAAINPSRAAKVLEIKLEALKWLPGGYLTSEDVYVDLQLLAGIYVGTVKVKRTENGYSVKGFYNQFQHPKTLQKVLREANTNDDKIITRQEADNLAIKLYKENAK